jgi:glycerophosphoryl diester phosphodiesterase
VAPIPLARERPFYDAAFPLAIAHRGGDLAGDDKENSLAAFQRASDAGFVYGETDTVATSDGICVAFHGRRFARSGIPTRRAIERLSFAEVRRTIRIGGEPIPALEDVLTSFPHMRFLIDPKTWGAVRPLAALIRRLDLHDRVSVGAFDYRRTRAVAELCGGQSRLCTTIGMTGSSLLIARRTLLRCRATSFALPHTRIDPGMAERAHEVGMVLLTWTPNTRTEIAAALDRGADGVMSDRLTLLLEEVSARQRQTCRFHDRRSS